MDTAIINVTGDFHDYYKTGELYLKATMTNNNLEGEARYFYQNGAVKEEGTYKNNKRTGKWTYYYPNGRVHKVYDFAGQEPLIMEVYNSSGKATVMNGKGKFSTIFNVGNQCTEYEIYGNVLNGKKHGKWTWLNAREHERWTIEAGRKYGQQAYNHLQRNYILAVETFDEGKYVKGEMTDPQIKFNIIYANENLRLTENFFNVYGQVNMLSYAGTSLYGVFYPELQRKLLTYNDSVENQWLVVGVSISNMSKIKSINVASSINDQKLEYFVLQLLAKMTDWRAMVNNSKKVDSDLFFTILVNDNQMIIPADYIHSHR